LVHTSRFLVGLLGAADLFAAIQELKCDRPARIRRTMNRRLKRNEEARALPLAPSQTLAAATV
jgi:hypothetical protein